MIKKHGMGGTWLVSSWVRTEALEVLLENARQKRFLLERTNLIFVPDDMDDIRGEIILLCGENF